MGSLWRRVRSNSRSSLNTIEGSCKRVEGLEVELTGRARPSLWGWCRLAGTWRPASLLLSVGALSAGFLWGAKAEFGEEPAMHAPAAGCAVKSRPSRPPPCACKPAALTAQPTLNLPFLPSPSPPAASLHMCPPSSEPVTETTRAMAACRLGGPGGAASNRSASTDLPLVAPPAGLYPAFPGGPAAAPAATAAGVAGAATAGSSASAGAAPAPKPKQARGPRPRQFRKNCCQADDCRWDLSEQQFYLQRNHIWSARTGGLLDRGSCGAARHTAPPPARCPPTAACPAARST